MSLTAKDVEQIMQMLESSSFDRLNLEMDGVKLELVRTGAALAPRPAAPAPVAPPVAAAPAPKARQSTEEGLVEVTSPLLGIFYRAPKPGEAPFIEVGSKVETETIIAIVEVMKLMNSVPAGVTGEVVEILGANGELVEHGELLLLVRPEA